MDFTGDPIAPKVGEIISRLAEKGIKFKGGHDFNRVYEEFYDLLTKLEQHASTVKPTITDEDMSERTKIGIQGYVSDWGKNQDDENKERLRGAFEWCYKQAISDLSTPSTKEVTDEEIDIKLLQIADTMPDAEPDYFDALTDGFQMCAKWLRSQQKAGSEWTSEKPKFTEGCWLVTRTSQGCEIWEIKKLQSDEGWYWGWLDAYGDEYGDIKDMEAELYCILPQAPNQSNE